MDGVRNGQELGLITTQYNLETLCRFLVEYNMNPRAINFLQYRGLLGNANSHPGLSYFLLIYVHVIIWLIRQCAYTILKNHLVDYFVVNILVN